MKVRTTIKFVVEYALYPEFYDTKVEEEILALERTYVQEDPANTIRIHGIRGKGEFTSSVEKI